MDSTLALILGLGIIWYFLSKNVFTLVVWGIIGYLIACEYLHTSQTISVLIGLGVSLAVMHYSVERFHDKEDKEEKESKEPEATGKSGHVDLGTTILHAYRNLSPEQIGGMRRDTKELMELQKELMGTLAEMKPAIEQGAELLGTFGQFFGKPGE
jgi:hypothetical protein